MLEEEMRRRNVNWYVQEIHIITIELSSYSLFQNGKHLSRKSLLDSFFCFSYLYRFTTEGQKCLLNILIDIFFHIIIYFLYVSIYISSSHLFFQHLKLSSPLSYLHQFLPTVNFDLRLWSVTFTSQLCFFHHSFPTLLDNQRCNLLAVVIPVTSGR